MKKIIPVLFAFIFINVHVSAQTWRVASAPKFLAISGGCMADANTGFICGTRQVIYKTTDGGVTWAKKYQSDPSLTSYYSLADISFVDPSVGYAVGTKGRVLKTTDGGENWQILATPDSATFSNKAVKFFTPTTGYVLSLNGTTNSVINKTTDGGETWTPVLTTTDGLLGFNFYSPTQGIVVGGSTKGMFLYYTTDGTNWTKAPSPTLPPYGYMRVDVNKVQFLTDKIAYAGGYGNSSVSQPSIFIKTTDGGATWNFMDQDLSHRPYISIISMFFKDSLNGIAAGGTSYPGTVILKTTDGGINWYQNPSKNNFYPYAMLGNSNSDNLIIAGDGGVIFTSNDFGNTMVSRSSLPNVALYQIVAKKNKVFMSAWEGNFFRSTDHGATFEARSLTNGTTCLNLHSLFFVNENVGFTGGQNRQIFKTTDGGDTWNVSLKDSNMSGMHSAMYFFNENKGMVVGYTSSNSDIIYNTTDGGTTWSSRSGFLYQNLYSVDFADANYGAIGGSSAKLLYTTDGGDSWKPATVNSSSTSTINSISFYDGLNGMAVGTSLLLKTTDGGATWNPQTTPPSSTSLTSVCHKDASTLYISGGKYIWESTDAGNSWNNIMDTSLALQSGSTMTWVTLDDDNNLWVCAGGTETKVFTTSPLTGINDKTTKAMSFDLGQNYPNPFNPSTVISFNLNKGGLVKLKLYDVMGREVRNIYQGDMAAGLHKIDFNAAGLSSGVYFYSLQINNEIRSRKMTLLK